MVQLRITLVRSGIGSPQKLKETLTGMGLTKLHKTVIRQDRPEIRGMIRKIQQLVRVDAIAEGC